MQAKAIISQSIVLIGGGTPRKSINNFRTYTTTTKISTTTRNCIRPLPEKISSNMVKGFDLIRKLQICFHKIETPRKDGENLLKFTDESINPSQDIYF